MNVPLCDQICIFNNFIKHPRDRDYITVSKPSIIGALIKYFKNFDVEKCLFTKITFLTKVPGSLLLCFYHFSK